MSYGQKIYLVVEMADGRKRKYPSASLNAASTKLERHRAMVKSLGTDTLYRRAYIETR